jgi:hypothetical protein
MQTGTDHQREILALESALRMLSERQDDGYRILIHDLQCELRRLMAESRGDWSDAQSSRPDEEPMAC